MDLYLSDDRAAERADIIALSNRNDAASTERLRGYVREGMRTFPSLLQGFGSDCNQFTGLDPQFPGLLRFSTVTDSIPVGNGQSPVSVVPGDIIFNSFRKANVNPADFPDPYKIDPTRPRSSYSNLGTGFHACPGLNFAEQVNMSLNANAPFHPDSVVLRSFRRYSGLFSV